VQLTLLCLLMYGSTVSAPRALLSFIIPSVLCSFVLFSLHYVNGSNKNLCGRDGRTICGPQCVPKSTHVTLAHKRKQKFFYFGCSLVRRFYCKIEKLHPITGRTDRRTDRQTDRQSATQYAAPS